VVLVGSKLSYSLSQARRIIGLGKGGASLKTGNYWHGFALKGKGEELNIRKCSWALPSAGILFLGLAAQAWASSPQNLPPEPKDDQEVVARFKAADLNGDGKITREEAEKGLPRVAMVWDKVDVDKRGYITLEQLLFISNSNK